MLASFASACALSRRATVLVVLLTVLMPAATGAAQHPGDRAPHGGAHGRDDRAGQDPVARAGVPTPLAAATRGAVSQRRAAKERRAKRFGYRVLRRGMKGADVRVLQHHLSRAGFRTPVAGRFSRRTRRNVRRFQRLYGLRVDGVLGPRDVRTLRRVGAPGAELGPPGTARLRGDGTALAPIDAPAAVRAVIAAGNRIAKTPYRYGGGHGGWGDSAYDCSGSVSYALHGGGLLASPLTSTGLMSWGYAGHGRWITVYGHGAHAFMVVAGLRFDTSGAAPSRWQTAMRSASGFAIRHPGGL